MGAWKPYDIRGNNFISRRNSYLTMQIVINIIRKKFFFKFLKIHRAINFFVRFWKFNETSKATLHINQEKLTFYFNVQICEICFH